MKALIAALVLAAAAPSGVQAWPGFPDTVRAVAICGNAVFVGTDTGVARTDLDGAPQPFSLTVDGPVTAIAADCAARRVYVGGAFRSPRKALVSVDFEGALVGPRFPRIQGTVSALAVSSTDLWVGGKFASVGGVIRNGVARLDRASGSLTSFSIPVSGSAYGAVTEDSFSPTGETRAIALAPDGRSVYVAGNAIYGGVKYERRYSLSGAPLTWTSPSASGGWHEPFGLAVRSDGTVAIAEGGNPGRVTVTRPDFGVLARWTGNGNQQAVVWASDGSLWSGGHNQAVPDKWGNPPGDLVGCTHLQRFTAPTQQSSPIDCGWPAQGGSGPWALAATSDGVIVGGDIARLAGVPVSNIARLTP